MTEQKKENWQIIDIDKLALYMAEKDLKSYFNEELMYTSEIEDGHVKQVYTESVATWLSNQIEIYTNLIMQFTKPEEDGTHR